MDIETKRKFTIKSRIQSFTYAICGIIHAFKNERSIWLQSVCAIGTIIGGFIFNITTGEWIAIILCIGIVFACETMNTAIEEMVDFISPGFNKKAGLIKDLAAGAVLITAIMSAIIAVIIFLPKIVQLLK